MSRGDRYRRMPRRVRAERVEHEWQWTTHRGEVMVARPGDYRVWDPRTPERVWSVIPDAFAWGYRHVDDGLFEATGEVHARQIGSSRPEEVVDSLEGRSIAAHGEWIVTDPVGRRWVMSDAEFRGRYSSVETALESED